MPLIHEIFTAQNVAGFYDATKAEADTTLGERLFPARKQLGLKLAYIKGAGGVPVVLKASEFDTPATLRDRITVKLWEEEMPHFQEGMLVKERDRQELNTIGQTGNQALIDTITKTIFNDKMTLLEGAHARLEAMRMRVLATGILDIQSDGVAYNYDYGVAEENKGEAEVAWTESETADPIADIEKAIEALEEIGKRADVMVLNSYTFGLIRKAVATQQIIGEEKVSRKDVLAYLEDELELRVELKNDTFKDDDGEIKKYFPDGYVTFVPNATLGYTTFGTTPEESDLLADKNLDVQIVDTGIAITAETTTNPVNVETIVSMIALPSFENLDGVYMLNVVPTP